MTTILPFNIQKIQVQAKTRMIKAQWVFEPQTYEREVQIPALKDLIKKWYLTTQGYCVRFYEADQFLEAEQWCTEHAGNSFCIDSQEKPTSSAEFVKSLSKRVRERNLAVDGGCIVTNEPRLGIEEEIYNAMSQQISDEIDNEILSAMGVKRRIYKPAYRYFFFTNEDIATLFKLTWGGE